MNKSLEKQINEFLATKVKVEDGNERADAGAADVAALERIVQALIEAKWEPSYDGWVPVEPTLVNRSTHEPFHYQPVPQDPEYDQANFDDQLSAATFNVKLAAEDLSRIQRSRETLVARAKARAEHRWCDQHGAMQKSGPCPQCPPPRAKRV